MLEIDRRWWEVVRRACDADADADDTESEESVSELSLLMSAGTAAEGGGEVVGLVRA